MGNRRRGFASAQLVIPDVRMGHILGAGRGIGIQGDNIEDRDIGSIGQATQVQLDTESSQVDIFQFDRISYGDNKPLFQLDLDLLELLL